MEDNDAKIVRKIGDCVVVVDLCVYLQGKTLRIDQDGFEALGLKKLKNVVLILLREVWTLFIYPY